MDPEDGENGFSLGRAEIDTSAPFESVKEAAARFGGIGYWKPILNTAKFPQPHEPVAEEIDVEKVKEEAAQLERDLIVKERETLDVLKELESTKMTVEELKLKLQKQTSELSANLEANGDGVVILAVNEAEKENHDSQTHSSPCLPSPPDFILMELKQAKLNLTRTTNDLADIRTSVELFNKKIEKERLSLEKTRERLALSSSKILSLEQDLNQTRQKLELAKSAEWRDGCDSPVDMSRELERLNSEAEQFKKLGEAARSQLMKAVSEIEQTKFRIKTAEIRLVAAKKMKAAAKAAEAVALAEIKALSSKDNLTGDNSQNLETVTLSFEEYSRLTCQARDAEEISKKRVIEAMDEIDKANVSKMDVLRKVEEAKEEVKSSKHALEEALSRVEAANKGKLAVEEALRKWRSDHGQRRRSVHNSTRFKNSCPSHHRRDSRLLDVNGLNLVNEGSAPVLKPTLSIGQILSRKLLLPEEFETEMLVDRRHVKQKVSLGQMLSKHSDDLISNPSAGDSGRKQFPFSAKRKKSGFARFSLLLTKQSKKKNKPTLNLR